MRKRVRQVLAAGLALAMMAGLGACGGGSDDSSGNRGSSGGRGDSAANAQLAKENVYRVEEFDFPQLVDRDSGYVNLYPGMLHDDGMIYMIAEVNDWSKGGAAEEEIHLIAMKEDGSDIQVTRLDTSDGGEDSGEGASGSQTDNSDSQAVQEGASASQAAQEGASDMAEGAVDVDVDMDKASDIWEYTYYGSFVISPADRVYGIKNYNLDDYTAEESVHENHTYVCAWDMGGVRLWEKEIKGLRSDEEGAEWIYISSLSVGKDGFVELLLSGDNMYKMCISSEGEVSVRTQLSEESNDVLSYRQHTMVKEDGAMLVMYSDEDDWTKSYLVSYDPDTDTLGEPSELPSVLSWNGYGNMCAGLDSDLILTMNDGVYIFNMGDENLTKKMDYVNSDVNISNFMGLVELDENRFMGVYYENFGEEIKAAVFTYRAPSDIPDRAVIVLAGSWIGSDLRQRVVEFNRENEQYRIVLREYDSYNSYEDYNASYTKLNNDIITGGMPDILIAGGLPIDNYIAKGLLADVGKLIEQDSELSRVEFLENVFDAYSVGGKLYYVVPHFSVSTMIAKTSLVGDRTGWNLEEMQQVLATMGEDAHAMGQMTRSEFMSQAMRYCGRDFIDVETGKCAFDTQDFIRMMEYAKTLPEEIDWEAYYETETNWRSWESEYRDNRTLLMGTYISNIQGMNYELNGYFGEPVTFIGFPTESGSGSYIEAGESYVLSARSANLEGAWEFVRYYLTEEYQRENGWQLPVNRQIFMERAREATKKPTYTDEQGNEVEYDDTFWINGEQIPLEPLSQEQVDQMVDFILSQRQSYYYNEDILNIINEEMGAFYTGQKPAQEVADIIQSRAQIFVDENR